MKVVYNLLMKLSTYFLEQSLKLLRSFSPKKIIFILNNLHSQSMTKFNNPILFHYQLTMINQRLLYHQLALILHFSSQTFSRPLTMIIPRLPPAMSCQIFLTMARQQPYHLWLKERRFSTRQIFRQLVKRLLLRPLSRLLTLSLPITLPHPLLCQKKFQLNNHFTFVKLRTMKKHLLTLKAYQEIMKSF
jgi:hypothetical protein